MTLFIEEDFIRGLKSSRIVVDERKLNIRNLLVLILFANANKVIVIDKEKIIFQNSISCNKFKVSVPFIIIHKVFRYFQVYYWMCY